MDNHIPVLLLSAGILFAAAAVLYYVLAGLSVARKELKTDEAKMLYSLLVGLQKKYPKS